MSGREQSGQPAQSERTTPTPAALAPVVLVTGGAGYIGSHTCKALHRAGYQPVVVDNLSAGHRAAVRYGPLEVGDLLDAAGLDRIVARHAPTAILHFAAHAYVGESVRDPGKYYRNNVVGSLNLLEVARDHGIRHLVFSSSCATYGVPTEQPIGEHTPQQPVNPYGESKLMVERTLRDFAAAHGLQSVALRYFNAAGADPDGELGECHDPETHLIPLVIRAALDPLSPITVYGTDYPTPDGTAVRDYVHVADLADAHVRALDYLRRGGASTALNLGTGTGHSVREVLEAVGHVAGAPVPWIAGARRPGDPPMLVADAARARALLNWQPRSSTLPELIASAWRWHTRATNG
jgi:UDP-arabinose 4-epimerase